MDWDEARAKTAPGITVGESLEKLSVAELEARIKSLEAELGRVKSEIERKRAHEAAASKLFKS